MKISIDRTKFNRGLQIVSKVIAQRASLPILSNILLTAGQNYLKISGTDLELGITVLLEADTQEEGSFTVPARIISEFTGSNTDNSLQMEVRDNSRLEVKSVKFKAMIAGMSADEFPSLPEVVSSLELTLDLALFIQSLRQVVIACAQDDIRPALSGIFIKLTDQKITLAATDSFRLAEKIILVETKLPNKEIILPARAAQEVIRIAALVPEENKVRLLIGENQVKFQIGQIEIISRLIDASFPAYEKIIPHESQLDISVLSSEVITALRTARIFSSTGSNNVRLIVDNEQIKIASLTSERGESEMIISGEVTHHTEEKNMSVAYNARYLSDAVSSTEGERVVLFISGPKKPTVVRNPNDSNFQHLVMPVDIKE